MTASLECPGIDCWQALLGDTIAPELRENCERHLESCSSCQDSLHRAEACTAELRELGQKFGDPTCLPTNPTLSHFLQSLRNAKGWSEPPRSSRLTFTSSVPRTGRASWDSSVITKCKKLSGKAAWAWCSRRSIPHWIDRSRSK